MAAPTKTTVSLREGYQTTIRTRHHVYHADEPADQGGTDSAVTPSEMVMGALGSCIAITIKMYAERKQWPLEGVDVRLDYERFAAKDYPAYEGSEQFVHEIREAIVLHGPLDAEQRERLLEIAEKCPVSRLIALPSFYKRELLDALPELE
ncbi:MAG: OsmC family protein [Anaerolineae bacterium]|nr:OsmC family protein [Anaerolineae bacterium]MDW8172348.1 OsmC family protein [Anaerolineae bacterium]